MKPEIRNGRLYLPQDDPVMVCREIVGPRTFLVLRGDTEQEVRTEARRLLDMLIAACHDPYGGTHIEFLDGKFWTRLEYWTEKEDD